ncbi:MAG: cell division protein FtsA [Bacteroidota bacterium]
MDERIVIGVDIGTTKVCALVAAADDLGRINILGLGVADSRGLNRGVVVNIDKTVDAIRQAVAEAERSAGVRGKRVVVGIAGDHIQSFQSRGVITIREGEISRDDVERLIEDTRHVAIPADRKILHVIPQEYSVDGQDGVVDPVGMSGVRLQADVHIITGLVSATKNVHRCIEKAGYEVADLVLEPLASSRAVLHREEKEIGVALVDIGGGTTDVAVFEDGMIRHTAVVAIAGNQVTDDIRRGLAVMREHAEDLKINHGSAMADLVKDDLMIRIPGIANRPDKQISRTTLAQIIQPRLEEILEIVGVEIHRSGYADRLGAGVVLTGGGSMIPGTEVLAAEILGMETRIGRSMGLSAGLVEEVSHPKFATGVGLTLMGLKPDGLANNPLLTDVERLAPETEEPDLEPEASLSSRSNTVGGGRSMLSQIGTRMKEWFEEI